MGWLWNKIFGYDGEYNFCMIYEGWEASHHGSGRLFPDWETTHDIYDIAVINNQIPETTFEIYFPGWFRRQTSWCTMERGLKAAWRITIGDKTWESDGTFEGQHPCVWNMAAFVCEKLNNYVHPEDIDEVMRGVPHNPYVSYHAPEYIGTSGRMRERSDKWATHYCASRFS